VDPSDLNPYKTPEGLEDPREAHAERVLDLTESVRAAGSLSLDEWHEAEWLIRQPPRGTVNGSRPKSRFGQYAATACCAYLVMLGMVIWRGIDHPMFHAFLAAIGAIIFGTLAIYWMARTRLHRQWKRHAGPFQPVEFAFERNTLTIATGQQRSELAWHEFDFYRRNRKVLLLHVRGAISSLIVARGMFASPEEWEAVCGAIDRMFQKEPGAA
jgi:hypothetical protein